MAGVFTACGNDCPDMFGVILPARSPSVAAGVGQIATAVFSWLFGFPVSLRTKSGPPSPSDLVGVGHSLATAVSVSAMPRPCRVPELSASSARAVGQDEQALALMVSASFFRREQSRRNPETQPRQVASDDWEGTR